MKINILSLVLIVVFLSIGGNLFSQKRSELEAKKREKLKQIENVGKLIDQIKNSKTSTFNKINLITKKIALRNEIIEGLNNELKIIEDNIGLLSYDIIDKSEELKKLKIEYSEILYSSYYRFRNYNTLMFIMASNSFNQAYRRFYYLKQYTIHRKNILSIINGQIHVLENSISEYRTEKAAKLAVLQEREKENNLLEKDKLEQDRLVQEYSGKEAQLKKELKDLQEATRKIESEIEKIIKEEALRAQKKPKAVKDSEKKLMKDFDDNKGRLPWPVSNATITSYFGEHPHPVYKGIMIKNNGIDLSTECNTNVKSVFEGIVSKIFAIKGANYAIIIRHGNYLSVYQNINEIAVKNGEKVKTNQVIGKSFCAEDESLSNFHFELWKDLSKLNPIEWLNK